MVHNNPLGMLGMLQQLRENPMALLSQRFNIPTNMQNPQEIVQYLLNSGQVTQAQVNNAMQMRNNPQFRNLFR